MTKRGGGHVLVPHEQQVWYDGTPLAHVERCARMRARFTDCDGRIWDHAMTWWDGEAFTYRCPECNRYVEVDVPATAGAR